MDSRHNGNSEWKDKKTRTLEARKDAAPKGQNQSKSCPPDILEAQHTPRPIRSRAGFFSPNEASQMDSKAPKKWLG